METQPIETKEPLRVGWDQLPGLTIRTGIGRYARELSAALPGIDGIEVVPLPARAEPPTSIAARIGTGLHRELAYYPWLLDRRARRARVDVVHVPCPFPARTRVPLVLTVHDALPWRHPELFTRVNALHQRLLVTHAARRAARVVTVSAYSRGELVELLGLDPARVCVVANGVSPRFAPGEPDRDALRRLGVDGRYLLAVGTLEPRKNLDGVLAAFERIDPGLGELTLVVTGPKGWKTAGLERALGRARRVVATGFVRDEELVALYRGAACFAYPSLYEGFGLPPLEAMACGAPVVTSDRTSLPEVVGDAAVTVDPTDADALAGAIGRVLADPALAARLRARGPARAGRFGWDRCAAETAAVYREAVSRP